MMSVILSTIVIVVMRLWMRRRASLPAAVDAASRDGGRVSLMVPERDLARVCGGMDAAYILKRVRDWTASNERLGKAGYRRDGQWWCVQSYRQWADDAEWLSVRQVETHIRRLEERGLIVAIRWVEGGVKGYRVDEGALAKALAGAAVVAVGSPVVGEVHATGERVHATGERVHEICERVHAKTRDKSIEESLSESLGESSHQSSDPPPAPDDDDKDKPQKIDDLIAVYGAGAVQDALERARQWGARSPVAYARRILEREKKGGLRPTPFSVGERYAAFIDTGVRDVSH